MTLRALTQAVVGLVIVAALALVILAADKLLTLWARLAELGSWAPYVFLALLLALAALGAWLLLRLIVPGASRAPKTDPVHDAASLAQRIAVDDGKGVETAAARKELETLTHRQSGDTIYLSFFGAASSGKSSLVEAMLPEHRVSRDVLAGTTRDIVHYRGERGGLPIVLADVPGFGHEPTESLLSAAREEAIRAHLVLYVAEGDLDRRQVEEVRRLESYGKPMVLVLNKADRYQAGELARIEARLAELCADADCTLVRVSAGGEQEVIIREDGTERLERRPREPEVDALWRTIDAQLRRADLDHRAEHSALQLASEKLAEAEAAHRRDASEALTRKYSRRAVIGALAALTPGSDLVIQAALATRFLREMGQLYEINVREIEVEKFLTLAGDRLKRTTALVLAVTGNAFKAFPGLGTLAGGVVHAAAYGMIFDSIGRSVAATLEQKKGLDPVWAAEQFERQLGDQSASRAADFARLALSELNRKT